MLIATVAILVQQKPFMGGTTHDLLRFTSRIVRTGALGVNNVVKGIGPATIFRSGANSKELTISPSYSFFFDFTADNSVYLLKPSLYPYSVIDLGETFSTNSKPVSGVITSIAYAEATGLKFQGEATLATISQTLPAPAKFSVSKIFESLELCSSGVFMKKEDFYSSVAKLIGGKVTSKNGGVFIRIDPEEFRKRIIKTLEVYALPGGRFAARNELRRQVIKKLPEAQLLEAFENPDSMIELKGYLDKKSEAAIRAEFDAIYESLTENQKATFNPIDPKRPIVVILSYKGSVGFIGQDHEGKRVSF